MQDDVHEKGACRNRSTRNRRMVCSKGEARLREGAGDVAITLFRPKIQELWDAIANGINGL